MSLLAEWKVRPAIILSILFFSFNTATTFRITCPQGGVGLDGVRPFRLEIQDLMASGPAFDLFILASKELQNIDQQDPLSYFQVAG
jgi:tyrosinase